jgi:hypothetical protein
VIIPQLERQGVEIQSKVEELGALNQSMRDRDKLKDDAIAHLSDQLIALAARLASIENDNSYVNYNTTTRRR